MDRAAHATCGMKVFVDRMTSQDYSECFKGLGDVGNRQGSGWCALKLPNEQRLVEAPTRALLGGRGNVGSKSNEHKALADGKASPRMKYEGRKRMERRAK